MCARKDISQIQYLENKSQCDYTRPLGLTLAHKELSSIYKHYFHVQC